MYTTVSVCMEQVLQLYNTTITLEHNIRHTHTYTTLHEQNPNLREPHRRDEESPFVRYLLFATIFHCISNSFSLDNLDVFSGFSLSFQSPKVIDINDDESRKAHVCSNYISILRILITIVMLLFWFASCKCINRVCVCQLCG